MSRWLSEPQREQPWNGIGSVRAPSWSAGNSGNATRGKTDQKQDSGRATRGSAGGVW